MEGVILKDFFNELMVVNMWEVGQLVVWLVEEGCASFGECVEIKTCSHPPVLRCGKDWMMVYSVWLLVTSHAPIPY